MSAYIAPTARLDGSARIGGSAWVGGSAQITGSAWIGGLVWIDGSARIDGSAVITGSAWVGGTAHIDGYVNLTDHMVADRTDGYITLGPIGSEGRTATAAWDYKRREICVRAGCWYGSLEELEARIAPGGEHGWDPEHEDRYRTQYECLIAAASWIPEPDKWPTVKGGAA